MLTVVADTSHGNHDLLLSACDVDRYRLLGHQGYHANCVDNLHAALQVLGLEPPGIPSPVNVFEKVSIDSAGGLHIEPPTAKAGDRSEEHTSELQSLMRISYAVFCLKKKTTVSKMTNKLTIDLISKYLV